MKASPLRTLLVTRPQPQAEEWGQRLRHAGVQAHALPLIATAPPSDPLAVRQAWLTLRRTRLVMFVSPASAQHFFALRPAECDWPEDTLAAAPGPGTAAAVRQWGAQAGLRNDCVLSPDTQAAQFDSEHLWPVLQTLSWQGAHVLIASGGQGDQAQGRQWLTERWREHGASVHAVVCYQRGPARWSTDQQGVALHALQDAANHAWLFSASEAIQNLVRHQLPALLPDQTTHGLASIRALCTHPRVAETAKQAGIMHTRQCAPTLEAIVNAMHQWPARAEGAADTMDSS